MVPHGIYVRDDIHKVADLKGKIDRGVGARIRCPTCWRVSALAKYGITADQVKLAAVGGDRERYQALAGGVVEGAVVSNEYQPTMPKNIHLLVAGRDAVPNFLRVCMITSGKVLAERGDDAVHFLAAEMQALALCAVAQGRDGRADAARSSTPSPTIRARPSSTTTRSRTTPSIPSCRSRRTSSNGCRSRWSKPASCKTPLDQDRQRAGVSREGAQAVELVRKNAAETLHG